MGTRSETSFMDGDNEICRIYRQMDGYPSGHGLDLAKICNLKMVNGYTSGMQAGTHANGIGCLAAQVIQRLKEESGLGGIYLQMPSGPYGDWTDYVYVIRGNEGSIPTIECKQTDGTVVFGATPANEITESFVANLENA